MSVKRGVLSLGAGLLLVMFALLAGPAAARTAASQKLFLPVLFSPVAPLEFYETSFKDNIEPWTAVRWQKNSPFTLSHEDGCENGECGLLQLKVQNGNSYAIASPLLLGPQRPYIITFHGRLKDREDKHQYGVAFGADAGGAPCPGDNTDACFNHYYAFRVRYRDTGSEQYLEYRLQRVDGHDEQNIEQAKDLIPWTRVDGIQDPSTWVKWEVRYGVRGDISIKANNNELPETAKDLTYGDPTYFGVEGRAGDNGDARALFSEFRIALDN